MQLTLVSHYGGKPVHFANFAREAQRRIAATIAAKFRPYGLDQVHATIIGLEGTREEGGIRSENFWRLRREQRCFDLAGMQEFLRHDFRGFDVQVGGFHADGAYAFTSQGQPPFIRSFSIRGETAVAMGWPRQGNSFPPVLDELRRSLQRFGALRKWAWREGEVDNDFYFVLGQIDEGLAPDEHQRVEADVRRWMASNPPLTLRVEAQTLAFVAYEDVRLPPATTHALPINNPSTTAQALAEVYG